MTQIECSALAHGKAAYQEAITAGIGHDEALECALAEYGIRVLFLVQENMTDDYFMA